MNEDTFFKDWVDLTTKEKLAGLFGWTIIAGTGVICYKLGKRAGVRSTFE